MRVLEATPPVSLMAKDVSGDVIWREADTMLKHSKGIFPVLKFSTVKLRLRPTIIDTDPRYPFLLIKSRTYELKFYRNRR